MVKTGKKNSAMQGQSKTPEAYKHEIDFWKGFVQTERFLQGWLSKEKTPELRQEVYDFIQEHLPQGGKILDVGSGVVSLLYGSVPNESLFALDLLAEYYSDIFDYDKYGIDSPAAGGAEGIEVEKVYDIVHCSNALDHCQNPDLAYQNMLKAVNPGGYLIVQGFEDEGQYEKYKGFHQWNIHLLRENLFVCDKNGSVITSYGSPFYCKNIKLNTGKDWFVWIVRK